MMGFSSLAAVAACMAAASAAALGEGEDYTTTTPYWDTTTDPTECPTGWINSEEGCFLFHYAEITSWTEAQFLCEQMGGFLAEPKSPAQGDLLVSLALLEENLVGVQAWWIGLTDQSHEGRWLWAHSVSDVSSTDWVLGSPLTGVNSADCAVMSGAFDFRWTDTTCNTPTAAPICQKLLATTTTTSDYYTTTEDYRTTTEDYYTTTSDYYTTTEDYRTTTQDYRTTTEDYYTTTEDYYTTDSDMYLVELRGGLIDSEYALGNVFAMNSRHQFGPVCDDSWGSTHARVVCRQLGYDYGLATARSQFGDVPEDFAMDTVICYGDEEHLQDCTYDLEDNCTHDEGAGVYCYNEGWTTTERYVVPDQELEEDVDW